MAVDRYGGSTRRYQTPPPTTTTGTTTPQGPVDIGQAIDEVITGAGGGTVAGPQPIGVGPAFQATGPYYSQYDVMPHGRVRTNYSARTPYPHRPLYAADDEYAPANMAPNVIANIQRQLAQVGLFDTNVNIISGDWGEETATAFRRLLAYANQHGMSWQIALNNLRAQVGAGSVGLTRETGGRFKIDSHGNIVPFDTPPEREPLVTRTTDPRTVNILLRELSMNLLGQALSQDQVQMMTAAYNQMEVQRQQEAYDAQITGGSVLDIPSPEQFGQAEIEAKYPTEVAANRGMELLNNAMSSLASPAWGI